MDGWMTAGRSPKMLDWRDALAETAKIPRKHLLTLKPGISEPQTTQMANSNLQLVVPQSIQESYTAVQRDWL